MANVKIRYREIVIRSPQYGRFPEYQVVLGRKIIFRGETERQAQNWCKENGHTALLPNQRQDHD